jgi:hypothetical protein
MKKLLQFLFTALLLFSITAVQSQTTVTLNATLSGKVTNANVKTDGGISNICSSCDRGYVKFDLSSIPSGAVISSAVLKLSAISPSVSSSATNTITSTTLDAAAPGAGFYAALGSAASAFSGAWSFSSLPNTFSMTINAAGITSLTNRIAAGHITYGVIRGSTNMYHFAGYNDAVISLQPQLVVSYTVPSPCSGTPVAGTATPAVTSLSCGGSTSISLSGSTPDAGISFQWQEFDGADWVNATGGSGSTTTVYNTPVLASSKQYRCMVTCSNSGLSDVSNTVAIGLTTLLGGTASANSSVICAGNNVIVTASGVTTGAGITYQWQEYDGSSWISAVGGTGANTLTYSSPALNAGISYRLLVTCAAWGSSVLSNEVNITVNTPASSRLYVTTTGNGTQDGSDWANAMQLGDALKRVYFCSLVNELFVKGGTYYPKYQKNMTDTTGGFSRFGTFYISSGVKIYGGFAGTETSVAERDASQIWNANKTLLSGDLGIAGNKNDNAYHVVYMINPSASTQLNGLQVAYGFANGVSTDDTYGAGMFIENTNTASGVLGPQMNQLIISNHFSNGRGGGIYYRLSTNASVNFKLMNSVLAEDTANGGFGGGAIRFDGVSGTYAGTDSIINCVFYKNTGTEGGAIKMDHGGSGLFKTNVLGSTFYGNVSSVGNDLTVWSSSSNGEFYLKNSICYSARTIRSLASARFYISNSIVNGSTAAGFYNANIINAGNVKAEDPKFMNTGNITGPDNIWGTADDGLQIGECSNARDFGLNTNIPSDVITDITGVNRIYNSVTDIGAYEASTPGNYILATSAIAQTVAVDGTVMVYNNISNCELIAAITPQGAAPVAGNTNFKVWIETTQHTNYLKRHYEITPASNAASATGRVTLYFTQQEFDDYNAVNTIDLPTAANDNAGKANLLIEKFPGVSNDGTGLPASYTGASLTINPVDTDIVWNSIANRWEVSFSVTGFSGFFVRSISGTLPVNWISVNAKLNQQKQAVITWKVQEHNVANYTIEKSTDRINYSSIGTVSSKGDGEHEYSFTESISLNGKAYYRIKQADRDGKISNSHIMLLNTTASSSVSIYPNPTTDVVTISSNGLINTNAVLSDINGRVLQTIRISSNTTTVNMSGYANGMYLLQLQNGETIKLIKQ